MFAGNLKKNLKKERNKTTQITEHLKNTVFSCRH